MSKKEEDYHESGSSDCFRTGGNQHQLSSLRCKCFQMQKKEEKKHDTYIINAIYLTFLFKNGMHSRVGERKMMTQSPFNWLNFLSLLDFLD